MVRTRSRALASALALVLLGWSSGSLAHAEDKIVFTIKDSRITKSSGLTRDVPGGRYWTINDSDNSARAYAIGKAGTSLGYLGYRAKPVDVEALSYFKSNLYLADIGDNTSKRETITIYKIYNPTPNGQTTEYQAYDFTYPDGPRDAEALLINSAGRMFIVSKEADGGIYEAPKYPSRLRSNRLKRIHDAPSFVTDGQFLPDGDIALRTYVSVQILDPKTYKVIAQAPTPAQRQGESLTVNLAGNALLVGSEGKNQPVYSMAIPTTVQKAPAAAATPGTPKATPIAAGSPKSTDNGTDGTTSDHSTLYTLLVAGALAVVAGLVTFGVRSRGGSGS